MAARRPATRDKRRTILDAAVRVFARRGFHTCRVSDVADEAGVAYGLVYHYFDSKDAILDTLFRERWDVLLQTIAELDARELSVRDKLYGIASFIVDSYRHDPELMQVIIVEVTRAASTFGRTHLDRIREAYTRIAHIVERAQAAGELRGDVAPDFAALAFYGTVEQVLTAWIFRVLPAGEEEFTRAKTSIVQTICDGLRSPCATTAASA
jgi:AcrR family transcriptional regulator